MAHVESGGGFVPEFLVAPDQQAYMPAERSTALLAVERTVSTTLIKTQVSVAEYVEGKSIRHSRR
jgi:hypothetical protein